MMKTWLRPNIINLVNNLTMIIFFKMVNDYDNTFDRTVMSHLEPYSQLQKANNKT